MKKWIQIFLYSLTSLFFISAGSFYNLERDYRHDLIRQAPPPDLPEALTPAPGIGHVWIPGHWTWKMEYIWQPGHWTLPPNPYSRWLNGNWDRTSGGWVWIPGRWT